MSPDFESLVRDYYQALYRFAFSLCGSAATAADLTQHTYMIWAERGHQLRDPARAKSWLFTTLYREFVRERRQFSRFPSVELDEAESELPAVSADAIARVEAGEVMDALAQVDDVFRAPLSLHYIGNHGYAEIAEILDVPVGTVMSRISRGKQQMRRLLAGLSASSAQRARVREGASPT